MAAKSVSSQIHVLRRSFEHFLVEINMPVRVCWVFRIPRAIGDDDVVLYTCKRLHIMRNSLWGKKKLFVHISVNLRSNRRYLYHVHFTKLPFALRPFTSVPLDFSPIILYICWLVTFILRPCPFRTHLYRLPHSAAKKVFQEETLHKEIMNDHEPRVRPPERG